MKTTLNPFWIQIPEEELQDLRRRLINTRLPPIVYGPSWQAGTNPAYLRDLLSYWAEGYNWRQREEWLNTFNHYLAEVDGVPIHFIRSEAKTVNAVPLLLMQGWPSSFIQVVDFLPLLSNPVDKNSLSFEVIAVSLPGYAFSGLPKAPGMSFARIAELMVTLMVDILGFKQFAAPDLDPYFGRDKLLDNISLHWFSLGGAGAIRLYHEASREPGRMGRVEVPTAIAMPLRDGITVPAPRKWAERFYNVQQWTVMERGGHIPEWEVPTELAHDISKFFSTLNA